MLLIAVHSNMCGIFQQQFSKYKVTMTTLCDEIEAGIATSFNCFIQCDFQRNQANFHDINNYSKGSEGKFSIYLPNSKTILFRTPSSIIPGRNKIIKENYISTYGLTTLNKPKSREVSTNDVIITQNIFNAAVPTSIETK